MIPKVHDCGQLTVADLFLLSLIAEGIDSRSDLVEASGIAQRRVYKRLKVLTGGSWIDQGKIYTADSPALVQMRKHPHQGGMQLLLTADGEELLAAVHGITQKRRAVLI